MDRERLQEGIELLTKEGYRKDESGFYVKRISKNNHHVVDRLHPTEILEHQDLDTLYMYIKVAEVRMKEKLLMDTIPSLRELIGVGEIDTLLLLRRAGFDIQTQHRVDFIVGDLSGVSGKPYYVALKHREGSPLEILTKEGVQYYQRRVAVTIILGPAEMRQQLENLEIVM